MLAHRLATSVTITAAIGTVLAALALTPRPAEPIERADDGLVLRAHTVSEAIVAGDQHVAVRIVAPGLAMAVRPPLSVAVVIDRSSSMTGEPLEHAKAAAARLVAQLEPHDAFSIITYATTNETLVDMRRATGDAKAAAIAAIGTIAPGPGTCISCGLEGGAASIARTPVAGGLRRIVLVSDGQANVGLGIEPHTRDELVDHAAQLAHGGIAITSVGVGLGFDELTMTRIADVGRGNYHFIEDTRHLDAMFTRELASLARTVATDAHLVVTASPGTTIEEVYGYPMTRVGDKVIVPIADIRAGDVPKVVLRVAVAPGALGRRPIVTAELGWRRVVDNAPRAATATARAELVTDAARVQATLRPTIAYAIEQALSGRAIEQASLVYERDGAAAAQDVLRRRAAAVRANAVLAPAARAELEAAEGAIMQSFSTAPAPKATKVGRQKAHALAK